MLKAYLFFPITVVCLVCGCSSPEKKYNPYLSEEKLREMGFYAYVIPQSIAEELGVTRTIYLGSTSCYQADSSSTMQYSPVQIWYKDKNDQEVLKITLAPINTFYSPYPENAQINTLNIGESPLFAGNAKYYITKNNDFVALLYDSSGMQVVIISQNMDHMSLVTLIKQLEILGKNNGNPWDNICK